MARGEAQMCSGRGGGRIRGKAVAVGAPRPLLSGVSGEGGPRKSGSLMGCGGQRISEGAVLQLKSRRTKGWTLGGTVC